MNPAAGITSSPATPSPMTDHNHNATQTARPQGVKVGKHKMTTEKLIKLKNEIVDWMLSESKETLLDYESDRLCTGWHYLRWYPPASLEDIEEGNYGEVISGCEASPCYPESEYYSRGNHPITFWAAQVFPGWRNPESGLEWVECGQEEAQYITSADCKHTPIGEAQRLAEELGLGIFDTQKEACDAIISAGGWFFHLGDPVDGLDTFDLQEKLKAIVEEVIEKLQPPPAA